MSQIDRLCPCFKCLGHTNKEPNKQKSRSKLITLGPSFLIFQSCKSFTGCQTSDVSLAVKPFHRCTSEDIAPSNKIQKKDYTQNMTPASIACKRKVKIYTNRTRKDCRQLNQLWNYFKGFIRASFWEAGCRIYRPSLESGSNLGLNWTELCFYEYD